MFELQGKFAMAKVFADNIDEETISQIIELLNQSFCKDSKIRVMSDCHAGKGCVIGTTMTIKDKIVPNLAGVDIGCGVLTMILEEREIDFKALDEIIKNEIPVGPNIRTYRHEFAKQIDLKSLKCLVNIDRAKLSIGSLGSGNHHIEVAQDDTGTFHLTIHSGSRKLGVSIATYYQDLAYKVLNSNKEERQELINKLQVEGRYKDIAETLKGISKEKVKKDLAYVEGENFYNYLHDMKITQQYAALNRRAMADVIIKEMNKAGQQLTIIDQFDTIHNYIDTDTMILRKGAISAREGERVIIPINMRDGSLICEGLGNEDWNKSAPHGAGRLMSRSKAKEILKLEDFQDTMKGIYSSTVNSSTLDEAPMAYKPIKEIIKNISETVTILKRIKPLYNFKASD